MTRYRLTHGNPDEVSSSFLLVIIITAVMNGPIPSEGTNTWNLVQQYMAAAHLRATQPPINDPQTIDNLKLVGCL